MSFKYNTRTLKDNQAIEVSYRGNNEKIDYKLLKEILDYFEKRLEDAF